MGEKDIQKEATGRQRQRKNEQEKTGMASVEGPTHIPHQKLMLPWALFKSEQVKKNRSNIFRKEEHPKNVTW